MTLFEDREKAFEVKFAHDAEMHFLAQAKCNKMLGIWAAEILGKIGEAADAYADALVRADCHRSSSDEVYLKVSQDLKNKADEDTIRDKMREFLREAKMQMV
jgi:hypothetical protein